MVQKNLTSNKFAEIEKIRLSCARGEQTLLIYTTKKRSLTLKLSSHPPQHCV